ncbi:hypothetical protein [Sinomicrobium weinanense]|uniref:Uncharacterized protein n=1 Tax=Sinomicrobium weinanense TaxID=2842200 RepID=A0A926Q3E1_9FLAO|nr:hypothetical protein [Sinomicrobium weinanense]MBC9796824.1 hypothetical protein [Sinomicrobium weinanense]MBU3123672.1 hypothetical protein [Sinomicrobium weinanense]
MKKSLNRFTCHIFSGCRIFVKMYAYPYKMIKNVFLALTILFVVACQEKKKEIDTPEVKEEPAVQISLPELRQFDAEKQEELNRWAAYAELHKAIRDFRKEKGGDVPLQLDNLLEKEKELAASDFPEKFDNPSVKSRLAALKTYLMQTRLEAPDPVPESYLMKQKVKILDAFNALDRQLYVMMQGSVTEEFLDELSNKPLAERDSVVTDSIPADSIGIRK